MLTAEIMRLRWENTLQGSKSDITYTFPLMLQKLSHSAPVSIYHSEASIANKMPVASLDADVLEKSRLESLKVGIYTSICWGYTLVN